MIKEKTEEITALKLAVERLRKYFPLSDVNAEKLLGYCEMRYFDKKVVMVDMGETDQYLNLIYKGMVRKFIKKGRSEVTLQLSTEGHFVHSENSFLKQVPSGVMIETLEPTTMISISYTNFQKLLNDIPESVRMARLLVTAMFVKKDARHYKELEQTTRERFLEYMQSHPHMLQRVPQKYLASYLNIKPETFSRLKHLLKTGNKS